MSILVAGLLWGAASMAFILHISKRKEQKRQEQFLIVGGRTIAKSEWSDEVLDQIRAQYFRPAAKDLCFWLVDLTATCPKGDATRHRVGIITEKTEIGASIVDVLPKTRAKLPCYECGKPAKLTAKSIVNQSRFEDWDGSF